MITIHERVSAMVSAWRSRLVRCSQRWALFTAGSCGVPPRLMTSVIPRAWTLLPGVNSRSAGAMVTKPAGSSSLDDEPAGSSSLGNPFRWCESNSRA
jgi:hypothetical protein